MQGIVAVTSWLLGIGSRGSGSGSDRGNSGVSGMAFVGRSRSRG